MLANQTMLMTKIERPALGLLSLVGKRGALAYRAFAFIAGTTALRTTSINQHAVAHAAKHVRRFNASNWKRSIRRPRKPRVANG
ncbi:MAG TPA: hypothetical protein VNW52_05620 [Burkholderiaceae bacterium]|nr:hypothetical protein [Burkholderiaceae bacterium]